MRELVISTRNPKKLKELKRLLKGMGIDVMSLDSFNGLPKVKEDGVTFRQNAKKKAIEISRRIDKLVMADDSGLLVSALGDRPGINSARYAGRSKSDKNNNMKLLREMRGLSGRKRRARFISAICLSKGRKVIRIVEAKVEGVIADRPRGGFGFGYDPLFIPKGYNKTFGQLGADIKDSISHRALALKKAKKAIRIYFQRYP